MEDRVDTFLGIPTAFFWAMASVCLGVVGSSWLIGDLVGRRVDFHWWHMAASVSGLLVAIMVSWRTPSFWPLAAIASLLNLPTVLIGPFLYLASSR